MVVMNNNEHAQTMALKRYSQMLHGYSSGVDPLNWQNYKLTENLTIPAQTALILELIKD